MAREQIKPEVGMGATLAVGSDAYPYSIIEVSASGKRIKVRQDKATRMDENGLGGPQEYLYSEDIHAPIKTFSLRKDGYWRPVGAETSRGYGLWVGARRFYQDPSF